MSRDHKYVSTGDEYGEFVKTHVLPEIKNSDAVVTIVPEKELVDPKIATELGAAIFLDKPIFLVVLPGREIPPKLEKIADAILVLETDDPETIYAAVEVTMHEFFESMED